MFSNVRRLVYVYYPGESARMLLSSASQVYDHNLQLCSNKYFAGLIGVAERWGDSRSLKLSLQDQASQYYGRWPSG